ncbi:MAG TPA: hypothetical protein VG845_02550 [Dehalococcoidia bacterium]|nr:hypothetical protein [Dehalococcoidia bacterium]
MAAEKSALDQLCVYAWETVSRPPASLLALEAEIGALLGWSEGIPIVTCQRYEVITLDHCPSLVAQQTYRGPAALLHIARLASGLESLVLGEGEIFGQVRSAFSAAPPGMRRLIAPAIASARVLRREAGFDRHAGYVLDIAIEHANLAPEGTLLVVGGGPMGRRVAERATQMGFDVTLVARRPPPLPPGVTYKPFSLLPTLGPTDVLVSCLGRSASPLGESDLPPVRRLAIDLGTLRNLKPGLTIRTITLANALEAQRRAGADWDERRRLGERLAALLGARLALRQPDSPIVTLRGEIERIRQRELLRSSRLHPDVPPEKLDAITRSLVNQIFHRPTLRLRQSDDPDQAEAFAALFRTRAQETDDDGA